MRTFLVGLRVASGLPVRVRDLGDPRATFTITTADSGEWDAAFDLWFDAPANPPGQNYGAELMIWTNHRGRPQPIGSRVGPVNLEGGTWDVWIGNIGWNVISYVRTTPANTMANFSVKAFTSDAVGRGQIDPAWFMTSGQAGFEPPVQQWTCLNNGAQQWQQTNGNLRNPQSNCCLDADPWGTTNGTRLPARHCSRSGAR
ncbi:ricin-type beta-trefoil lectin domain protein [Actinoplanes sp. LDG1-06]|uniref:Ricin-type beta-trefoil lectin domain protein n=1 Tax=Paractinoplanes ovalisporus TaxID=2810368 RepID=A0ABS2AG27_9ACTN|nr:ricin-type beta-trefoil lectin domain protein [Actinoplanes ovalisporus]MBM2618761.1 ricin-type beta-trefoil lectin domain protein [Actinoplanes ovalisporus]